MFFFLCFCFSLHPNQFNLGISAIVTSALSLPNLLLLHHQRFEQQMRNHEQALKHSFFCYFPTWFQYCNNHQMPTLQNPTSRNHHQKNFRNKHAKLLEIDLRSQNGFFSKANPQNPNPNKTWKKAWNFSKSHSSSSSSPKHTKEQISLTRWRKSKCKFSKHKPLPKGKKQTPDTKKGRKRWGSLCAPPPPPPPKKKHPPWASEGGNSLDCNNNNGTNLRTNSRKQQHASKPKSLEVRKKVES